MKIKYIIIPIVLLFICSQNSALVIKEKALQARIKNSGEETLSSNCKTWFYVRGQGINEYVGYAPAVYLKSGEKRWYTYRWIAPKTGNYTYYAAMFCKDKNGNTRRISPWEKDKIEIEDDVIEAKVTDIKATNLGSIYSPAKLSAKIENTGETTLNKRCAVRFYIKGQGIDRYVGYKTIQRLGAEDEEKYSINWSVPRAGEYTLSAAVFCKNRYDDWVRVGGWEEETFETEWNELAAEVVDIRANYPL